MESNATAIWKQRMQRPRAYCTYFDGGYLSRGLALIDSLRAHGDNSPMWVLALDDDVISYFRENPAKNVHIATLEDLENAEPALSGLRGSRTVMEYYFTCTPQLARFVMEKYSDPATTTIYLDADLYFFDSPGLVLDAMGDASVGIIEHRYPRPLAKRLAQYGQFNVGWVGFKADGLGRACLEWWAVRCLEWCYDRPEDGKYADQGYLDSFPQFKGVRILQPLGLNLAPWNTRGRRLEYTTENGVVIDGSDRLVFFHFHGLRRASRWYVTSQLVYGARLTPTLRKHVYEPYLTRLESTITSVLTAIGPKPPSSRGRGWRGIVSRLRKRILDVVTVVTGNAISVRRLTIPRA